MADDSGRSKRGRWDATEKPSGDRDSDRYSRDPRHRASASRSSRWDDRARSRSPPPPRSPRSASRRSRSPFGAAASPADIKAREKEIQDKAAAAAAAAAKINANIQAKRGIQHVDVPPIIKSSSAVQSPSKGASSPPNTAAFNSEMYIADGDYIKDIEVNDLRNRYTLTKGATQKMIKDLTGADVTTRGAYYPDKSMATAANPPLYLHITSTTKEGLEKAVAKIEELMKQDLPNLVDERRFRRREAPDPVERDEFGRRKWPEEKIPIGLEPIPNFNLRAAVVGHGGANVKHIQGETRCRVQIKGRGSGFHEVSTGQESDEPLYLHVSGPNPVEVQQAKGLCEDLIAAVKQQYEAHKNAPPQPRGGYGGAAGGGGYGGGYGGGAGGYGAAPAAPAAAAPPPAPGTSAAPGTSGANSDYAAAYAAYYGTADPYAAYGGYANYVQYYNYYAQQAAAAGGAIPGATAGAPGAPGAGSPPPPPPASATSPPPPPPPSSASQPPPPPGTGGYSGVRPPPGL